MTGKKKCKIDCKKTLKDLSENYWTIATIVLGILLVMSLFSSGCGTTITSLLSSGCGTTIGVDKVGQKVLDFANNQGANAELISTIDNGALYEVILSIDGQEVPVYATKDGENLIPAQGLIPLTANAIQNTQQQPEQTPTFSEEDNIKIQEFSSCLAEKDFKVYGAAWCGHCQTVVKTFGGMQNMEGVFIECSDANRQPTEHAQLCSNQQITGFPTMKLGNETLQIARTFEAIAEATGCTAPELN